MERVIKYIPQIWKAVTAFVLTASSEYALAQVDGVTWGEWGYIAGTSAFVAFGVWFKKNAGTVTPATSP